MIPPFQIKVASDSAFIVYLDLPLGEESAALLKQWRAHLLANSEGKIVDVITSYLSLFIQFDPFCVDPFSVKKLINDGLVAVIETGSCDPSTPSRVVELPVFYDVEVGPDLERIAQYHGTSIEETIRRHSSKLYSVYAIGFAPGFGYLGEVDAQIAMPRLATPRKNVAKGSVAIADQQTAIYPAASPGGWNIIGRCPIELFSKDVSPSMPFVAGDKVKFVAVDKSEFLSLGGEL